MASKERGEGDGELRTCEPSESVRLMLLFFVVVDVWPAQQQDRSFIYCLPRVSRPKHARVNWLNLKGQVTVCGFFRRLRASLVISRSLNATLLLLLPPPSLSLIPHNLEACCRYDRPVATPVSLQT